MSGIARTFGKALQRSLDGIKEETAKAIRMEVAPSSRTEGLLSLWALRSRADLSSFATGADKDIGGLSTCLLSFDEKEGKGRFYGTVTSDLPRGSRIERSGYAAFRNKNRPTLFGAQTWDTTVHSLLALRVRNRFAQSVTAASELSAGNLPEDFLAEAKYESSSSAAGPSPTLSNPSLRQALHASSIGRPPVEARAIHALGIGLKEPPGPKFFINIQTDGPVTSDLFQHRLYLDERMGDAWQTVLVPFDDFVLTNTGQVAMSQMRMMRERIRTVGISVMLEAPSFPVYAVSSLAAAKAGQQSGAPASLLKTSRSAAEDKLSEDDWGTDGSLTNTAKKNDAGYVAPAVRGRRRGQTYNFDLGIESAVALGSLKELDASLL
ncbi:NADH:ubiquinone oxidoreductase complex I intermediate-associated protein 30 [Tilletiaria anomala UBC 951]|uniref:NADH:ubiquinone oxidoreductase complex I intermediate-associated protein 30 n=1 Tax=Tilletiaria anomala (strain ATCC 24038 / CBS 436.72 / UBC 951) TaxID=1037660 RepID=A0A066VRF2_TILAU|nr:NADH:ubiquinone oxidoreductase complex I intermediate-associated protein 30 [Tilletiaria anomala UBC 951]KDN41344.1 NADH:ubiquinone oxidoreductase complex I intermediate-associated protein 30 [Tilletiaria anomala UBC 951]